MNIIVIIAIALLVVMAVIAFFVFHQRGDVIVKDPLDSKYSSESGPQSLAAMYDPQGMKSKPVPPPGSGEAHDIDIDPNIQGERIDMVWDDGAAVGGPGADNDRDIDFDPNIQGERIDMVWDDESAVGGPGADVKARAPFFKPHDTDDPSKPQRLGPKLNPQGLNSRPVPPPKAREKDNTDPKA